MQPCEDDKNIFSSSDGATFVRDLLRPSLSYTPHDYQVEGVSHCLDNDDLLAILPTGAGKTAYFSMLMLALRSLSQSPGNPYKHVPEDPAMIVVYPTTGLEEEMEIVFRNCGLSTLVINANTRQRAWRESRENLWDTARSGVSMILLSPEMLVEDGFERLINNPLFCARICAFAVDEVHLCDSWGRTFRPAFKQLPLIRARLPERVVLVLVTATLTAASTTRICHAFRLRTPTFHMIRRSNIRPNIQIIFRTIHGAIDGSAFPDLDWVLVAKRKTLIYCGTIKRGDRVLTYLHSRVATSRDGPHAQTQIRLYNAAHWPEYNAETRRLFRDDPEASIVIATDTLMVGFDIPHVDDVILLGVPATTNELLQKIGRAGRDRSKVPQARGIIYVPKTATRLAEQMIAQDQGSKKKASGGKKKDTGAPAFDIDVARMLSAECKTVAQNQIYSNPLTEPGCTCASCSTHPLPPASIHCNCSGCMPEDLPPPPVHRLVKEKDPLSRKMKAVGRTELLKCRNIIYSHADSLQRTILPPYIYLPEPLIERILLHCLSLTSVSELLSLISDYDYTVPHVEDLWTTVQQLQTTFADMGAHVGRKRTITVKNEDESETDPSQYDYGEILQPWKARLSSNNDNTSIAEPLYSQFQGINNDDTSKVQGTSPSKRKSSTIRSDPPTTRKRHRLKEKENCNPNDE